MRMQDIHDFARQLFEAHGDKAEAEAQQRAQKAEQENDKEQAEDWRRVRAAIREMRGSHVS